MRLLYYIKTTLKGLASNIIVTSSYFIIFPVILALVMGFAKEISHSNPMDIKELEINIIDEDSSKMSKKLIKFLESDNLKEFFKIDSEAKSSLTIKKGYEDELLSLKSGNLILNQKDNKNSYGINILKSVLDKYHENIYASLKNNKALEINNINNSSVIKTNIIEKQESKNFYKETIASMIGFIISSLIYMTNKSNKEEMGENLYRRLISLPLTRTKIYLYEGASTGIHTFIIIFIYIFFFRLSGIAFDGNLIDLLILILTGTFLVVSVVAALQSLFGKKLSNIIGIGFFLLFVFAGKAFGGIGRGLGLVSPMEYLERAFEQYVLNGSIQGCENLIGITFLISIVLFLIGLLKVKFIRERSI